MCETQHVPPLSLHVLRKAGCPRLYIQNLFFLSFLIFERTAHPLFIARDVATLSHYFEVAISRTFVEPGVHRGSNPKVRLQWFGEASNLWQNSTKFNVFDIGALIRQNI